MPSGTNGSERHRLRSGVWGRRGSVGSGPGPRLREGPALEPGMLTRRHRLTSSADRGSRPDPSFMTDVRVWTA